MWHPIELLISIFSRKSQGGKSPPEDVEVECRTSKGKKVCIGLKGPDRTCKYGEDGLVGVPKEWLGKKVTVLNPKSGDKLFTLTLNLSSGKKYCEIIVPDEHLDALIGPLPPLQLEVKQIDNPEEEPPKQLTGPRK